MSRPINRNLFQRIRSRAEENIDAYTHNGLAENRPDVVMSMLRVLVVDDNEPWLRVIVAALATRVAHVEIAANAMDGLQIFTSSSATFDVVVLDIHLPDMDGYELLKCIRAADDGVRATRTIAVSGDMIIDGTVFDLVLRKPINVETLIQGLETVCML